MAGSMAQAMQPGRGCTGGGSGSGATVSADEVVATLEKLHGLVGKGILSQAEFDTKKAELLAAKLVVSHADSAMFGTPASLLALSRILAIATAMAFRGSLRAIGGADAPRHPREPA